MFRIIADENVPYSIVHRLEHYGHNVEHVDFVISLGKGIDDEPIARYSIDTDRLILTNDMELGERNIPEYIIYET